MKPVNECAPYSSLTGLTEAEAAERLASLGYNELPSGKRRSLFAIALSVASEPMFLLLVGCGALYLAIGEASDAALLLGFVFVVMGITLYQERKTERALEALRDLSSPRALVIRDGRARRIPGREVAVGDLLCLSEGDRVPADAVTLEGENLTVDESLLTGESVPVRKKADPAVAEMGLPGGEGTPHVFSGTLVVGGRGAARVLATGTRSELGKIGRALSTLSTEPTRIEVQTARLVKVVAAGGLLLATLVVVIYGLTRGHWAAGLLAGVSLAMSLLPEEFPVVLTIFLALGAWRMSRQNVLTRRIPAVETLGAATVLCVDKTGTLTENAMTVSRIWARGAYCDMRRMRGEAFPEAFHELAEFAVLASQRDPVDPMDKALQRLGATCLAATEHLHDDWELLRQYPLSDKLLGLSHVWRETRGGRIMVAGKGAPEAICDLCHLPESERAEIGARVSEMAAGGLRVLGAARAVFFGETLPEEQHDFAFEFLGLVGFSDPVREGVPEAVRECREAGVRVVMITGDYPVTAQSIARSIGLENPDRVITGPELAEMDEETLSERVRDVNIFSRVVPEQKLSIVKAFKRNGEIVAMTGDGVNDAPALKAAHIGVAMGQRGTDVAREASDLVLLTDDFASIVAAIRLGRRIYENLKKAVTYIFAVHVPIAGMSLLPVCLGEPLVLFPVHIAFMELIIDPACTTVYEAEPPDADLMKGPPRDPKAPLFNLRLIATGLLQGLMVLGIVIAIYLATLGRGMGEREVRALTFTSLILANLGLILTNRSFSRTILGTLRKKNPAVWWVVGGTLTFLSLVLYLPPLRRLFSLSYLHAPDIGLCIGAGFASILWFEAFKLLRRKRRAPGNA